MVRSAIKFLGEFLCSHVLWNLIPLIIPFVANENKFVAVQCVLLPTDCNVVPDAKEVCVCKHVRIRTSSRLRDGIVHLVEGVEILHIVLGHLLKVYVPGFNLLIKGLSVVGLAFHLLEDVAELLGCIAG